MNNTTTGQDREIEGLKRDASAIVDYVGAVITIIEELDEKCDALRKEVEELNEKIDDLSRENSALKSEIKNT